MATTQAMIVIIERRGRRPRRSMRSQGMKDAKKNQSWRKPAIRAKRWLLKPTFENRLFEQSVRV